jgi:hypothetical protein
MEFPLKSGNRGLQDIQYNMEFKLNIVSTTSNNHKN